MGAGRAVGAGGPPCSLSLNSFPHGFICGIHSTGSKPLPRASVPRREVYHLKEDGNLIQTQGSLVAKREKDRDIFRLSRFTVENHEQV